MCYCLLAQQRSGQQMDVCTRSHDCANRRAMASIRQETVSSAPFCRHTLLMAHSHTLLMGHGGTLLMGHGYTLLMGHGYTLLMGRGYTLLMGHGCTLLML